MSRPPKPSGKPHGDKPSVPREPGFKITPGFEKTFWQTVIRSLPAKLKGQLRGLDRGQWPLKIVRLSAKDMRSLWSVFTSERGDISRYLHEPKRELLAYRLGFHLPNCARLQAGFERALPRGWSHWVGPEDKVRIIDLGCGAGSFAHTAYHSLTQFGGIKPERISVELIDQKKAFVDGAKDGLVDLGCPPERILTLKQGLQPWLSQFGGKVLAKDEKLVVGLTYVYNEIRRNPAVHRRLMDWFGALSQKDSLAVILEPGNQGLCQQAMELRDTMVEDGFTALYPCPTVMASGSLCPMRSEDHQRDWCYSEFRWEPSVPMANVDQILETDRKRLAGTLMIFAGQNYSGQKNDRSQIVTGRPVVKSAAPRKVPSTYQYLICTGEKLSKVDPKPQRKTLLRGETLSEGNS